MCVTNAEGVPHLARRMTDDTILPLTAELFPESGPLLSAPRSQLPSAGTVRA